MAEIVLDGVTKVFPDGYEAVKDMDLDIGDGEFMILVGPSGCGKSTALRMIAGLEDISQGEVKIGGEMVNERRAEGPRHRDGLPELRALSAHDRSREHGLRPEAGRSRPAEIDRKVEEAAEILDLRQHLDRRPANLSGGQRQRVAMGRAIVRDPKAFLLDEPLSNLDAKLRVQMRTELARLQSSLGTTTVYVTHDQTEAMTLGDRVAVMRAGELQQVGTPAELYNEPKNLFVAGFIGSPAMNFMPAELSDGKVRLPIGEVDAGEAARGPRGPVVAGLRPENFEDASIVGEDVEGGARASSSRPRSTSSSRLAPTCTPTSTSSRRGSSPTSSPIWSATALTRPAPPTCARARSRSSPGSMPPASIRRGERAELWADTGKLHLFDPDSGESLT